MDLLQRLHDVRSDDLLHDADHGCLQGLADELAVAITDRAVHIVLCEHLVLAVGVHGEQALLDDAGEPGVVAADGDRDQGGIGVEVSLVHLSLLTAIALTVSVVHHVVGASARAGDQVIVHARSVAVGQCADRRGPAGNGGLPGPRLGRAVAGVPGVPVLRVEVVRLRVVVPVAFGRPFTRGEGVAHGDDEVLRLGRQRLEGDRVPGDVLVTCPVVRVGVERHGRGAGEVEHTEVDPLVLPDPLRMDANRLLAGCGAGAPDLVRGLARVCAVVRHVDEDPHPAPGGAVECPLSADFESLAISCGEPACMAHPEMVPVARAYLMQVHLGRVLAVLTGEGEVE